MVKNKLYSVLAVLIMITAGTGALFASAVVDAGASFLTQIPDPGEDEPQIITGDPVNSIETWTSGDCTCTLNTDTGVFTVSGSGQMADYSQTPQGGAPWRSMAAQILSVDIEPGVTHIGQAAFTQLTSLTSVKIPASVTSIGMYAFLAAYMLTNIYFGTSVWNISIAGFQFSLGISSSSTTAQVYSPNNAAMGHLDDYQGSYTTFDYLSTGWTSGDCTCLLDLTTGAFTIVGSGSMANYDITSEQPWMIYKDAITSVSVGSGVTHIGALAFSGVDPCDNLTTVDLGSTVQSIGNQAFDSCTSLATVSFPSSLVSIGTQAFFGCTSLTSAIPSTVMNVGIQAFASCTSLTTARLYPGVNYGDNVYYGCTSITTVIINSGVTTITPGLFHNCTSISSVILPQSITTIGAGAFKGCASLVDITILAPTWNISSIGQEAFSLGSSGNPVSSTIHSPGNIADGQLDAYAGDYTTFTYVALIEYTVTFIVSPTGYGTVSVSTVTVPWGTQILIDENTLFVGSTEVIATPASTSVEYTYAFDGWSGIPVDAAITSDTVITANFSRSLNYYTVNFISNDPDYGSISSTSTVTVPANTPIVANDNVIVVGGQFTVTATPAASTAEYTYAFDQWTDFPSEGKITEDVVIGADFSRHIRYYTVSIVSSNTSLGTVDVSSVAVTYNTRVSQSDNVLTIGSDRSTATPLGTALFISWDNIPASGMITQDGITITAHFEQLVIVFSDLSVNPTMYGVIGKPLPWTYDPFSVSLNIPATGEWSITDPANTGLTINKKTGAFGGSVSSTFPSAGSALITVSFSPTGSSGSVSATFTLHYAPALIITS